MSRPLRERLLAMGLLGAALLLACSTAQAASAAQPNPADFFAFDGTVPAELRAQGSNGYSIEVEGTDRHVTLTANGPGGTAIYIVPGRVSSEGIAASFGPLGQVDVEFRPSRRMKVEMPPNRCEGKPRVTRWGVFAGTIRFVGERGYTRIRRHRARGQTHVTPPWRCKGPRGGGGGGPDSGEQKPEVPGESSEDSLVLEIANRQTGVEAGAFTFRPRGEDALTLFLAGVEERRRRMEITRFALVPGKDASFSFDDSLTTATIAPPAPFSGTATFQRAPGGPGSVTGSLSVLLPGTARIPLAGAGYRSRLFRLSEDGIALPGN